MMPSSSCSGVKLTELSRDAVSHSTSRRITCASWRDGFPYLRTATPSPRWRDQSATLGGWLFGLSADAGATGAPSAAAPPAARPARMSRRDLAPPLSFIACSLRGPDERQRNPGAAFPRRSLRSCGLLNHPHLPGLARRRHALRPKVRLDHVPDRRTL